MSRKLSCEMSPMGTSMATSTSFHVASPTAGYLQRDRSLPSKRMTASLGAGPAVGSLFVVRSVRASSRRGDSRRRGAIESGQVAAIGQRALRWGVGRICISKRNINVERPPVPGGTNAVGAVGEVRR